MGSAILARDPDTVIEMFKLHNSPFFSVIEGKNEIVYCYDEDDMNGAEEKLRQTLDYVVNSQSNAQFTIRVYADGEKITNKKEYKGTIPFKFSEYQTYNNRVGESKDNIIVLNGAGARNSNLPAAIPGTSTEAKLDKVIDLLTLMITKQQQDEEEEEEEPEEPAETMEEKIQRWTAIGSTIVDKASPLLITILDRIIPNKNFNNNDQTKQQMAGTTQVTDEQLQQAFTNLQQTLGEQEFRRVIVALGKMAAENPAQLQNLCKMV